MSQENPTIEEAETDENSGKNSGGESGAGANSGSSAAPVEIDTDTDDYAANLMMQQSRARSTSNHADPNDDSEKSEENEAKLENEIKNLAKDEEEQMSVADLYYMAEFIIELIDTFSSEGAKWYSGEESAEKFELPSVKKKKLAKLLAAVLYKYQVKLGPVAALAFMAIFYFGGVWRTAHQIRNKKKASLVLKTKKKKATETRIEKLSTDEKPEKPTVLSVLKEGPKDAKTIADLIKMKQSLIYGTLRVLVQSDQIRVDKSVRPNLFFLPKTKAKP